MLTTIIIITNFCVELLFHREQSNQHNIRENGLETVSNARAFIRVHSFQKFDRDNALIFHTFGDNRWEGAAVLSLRRNEDEMHSQCKDEQYVTSYIRSHSLFRL